jgi:hypothetical protein
MRLRGIVALAFAVSALSACSGGGGGGSAPPTGAPTLSGTAAANVPLGGYIVDTLTPFRDTSATSQTVAGSDGRYSVTVAAVPPADSGPFPIVAWKSSLDDQVHYPRVWSVAHRSGTANATPLTSLVFAKLLNRKPGRFDHRAVFDLRSKTEADVSAAQQQVVNYLLSRTSPVNAGAVGNFVSTPLTLAPGNAYFDALTQLHNSLLDSETIAGVEEHMLFGGDGPANLLAMLSLDFMANCTGAVASGSTRIIADLRAFNFVGVLDVPFRSSDQLTVTAGEARQTWLFTLGGGPFGGGQGISLSVLSGRLENLIVSTSAGGSECLPQSEVLLTGKQPSLIALIKRLAQSVAPIFFQCASAGTFFPSGTNALSFDTQGAVRFSSPSGSGPALHLASLDITVGATLTVAGSQVQSILPTSFTATREFGGGGSDSFDIRYMPGLITGVRLMRKDAQSIRSQTCGTI